MRVRLRNVFARVLCGLLIAGTLFVIHPRGASAIARAIDPNAPTPETSQPASPYVPGQLLVKFRSQAQPSQNWQAVTACATCISRLHVGFRNYTSDVSSSLDTLMTRYQATVQQCPFRRDSMVVQPETVTALQAAENTLIAALKRRFPKRSARIAPTAPTPQGLFHWYLVTVPLTTDIKAACQDWRADPHVEACEPNYLAHVAALPNDTYIDPNQTGTWSTSLGLKDPAGQPYEDLWGLKKIRATDAWNTFANPATDPGKGVVVAVLDTGVGYNHEDLAANIWTNPNDPVGDVPDTCDRVNNPAIALADDDCNGIIDDVRGADLTTCASYDIHTYACLVPKSPTNNPMDWYGHGTHVAGIIGAVANNRKGIAGVAPNAKIMPVMVFGPASAVNVMATTLDVASGFRYATLNGADVINTSLEVLPQYAALIQDAVQDAARAGVVVAASAGNAGAELRTFNPNQPNQDDYNCPACFDTVIAVGASTEWDRKADFSNFGSKVDLVAPGAAEVASVIGTPISYYNIWSLAATTGSPPSTSNYQMLGGTSMTSPQVAGVAALLLSRSPGEPFTDTNGNGVWNAGEPFSDVGIDGKPGTADYGEGNGRYDAFTVEDVRAALRMGTDDVELPGRDILSGFGRLNALKALTVVPQRQVSVVPSRLQYVQLDQPLALAVTLENVWLPVTGISATLESTDSSTEVLTAGSQTYRDLTNPRETDTRTYQVRLKSMVKDFDFTARLLLKVRGANNFSLDLPVVVPVAPTLLGWPITVAGDLFANAIPLLADVDGDGQFEIILAGSLLGKVYAWHQDGTLLSGWPVQLPPGTSPVQVGVMAAANLDDDPALEVIGGADGQVYAWNVDGTSVAGWPQAVAARTPGVAVADLDGIVAADGKKHLEVVASAPGTGRIYVWTTTATGAPVAWPGWPVTLPAGIQPSGNPALGDLDGDGQLEIIVEARTSSSPLLYVWHQDGRPVTGWTGGDGTPGSLGVSSPVVGDLNGTVAGGMGVVAAFGRSIYAWSGDGKKLPGWPVMTGDNFGLDRVEMSPILADIDQDPNRDLEIIVGTHTGTIWAWHHDGTPVVGWPQRAKGLTKQSPVAADVNLDGTPEIIQGGGLLDPRLYAWHGDGSPVAGWPLVFDGEVSAAPSVGNSDGKLTLVIGESAMGRVHAFQLPSAFDPVSSPWPTFQHDTFRTGNAQFKQGADLPKPPKLTSFPTSYFILEGQPVVFTVGATDFDGNLATLTAAGLQTGATFTLLGDLNGDGQVTQADSLLLVGFVLGTQVPTPTQQELADLDGNGTLDISDVILLANVRLKQKLCGRFRWIPGPAQGRSTPYVITFTATDAGSLSATQSVSITVGDTTPLSVTVQRCKPQPFGVCQPDAGPISPGTLFVARLSADPNDGDALTYSATSSPVPVCASASQTGCVRVLPVGDVTMNGSRSSLDASNILQFTTGLLAFTDEQKWLADVTGNGTISSLDAAIILQSLVGQAIVNKFLVLWRPTAAQAGMSTMVTVTVAMRDWSGTSIQKTVSIQVGP